MTPERTHDQKCFFKYVTADTGKKIIENSSFRWSSPSLFNKQNDPFDVPEEFAVGLDQRKLRIARENIFFELLRNPPDEMSEFNESVRLLLKLRKAMSPIQVESLLLGFEEVRNLPLDPSPLYEMSNLWKKLRSDIRILCLTTDSESEYMWLRYAENHKGLVIELTCLDLLDSVLKLARKVTYSDEPRMYDTAEGWARALLYEPEPKIRQMFDDYTLQKKASWAGEKEYRVITFTRESNPDGPEFFDQFLNPFHFARFILGSNMSDEDAKFIVEKVNENYPWAKIQRAKIGKRSMELEDL